MKPTNKPQPQFSKWQKHENSQHNTAILLQPWNIGKTLVVTVPKSIRETQQIQPKDWITVTFTKLIKPGTQIQKETLTNSKEVRKKWNME